MGAMALFGENYGDVVRAVEIGGRSRYESCSGAMSLSAVAESGPITHIGGSRPGRQLRGIRRVEGLRRSADSTSGTISRAQCLAAAWRQSR